jgi:hypothetical protein
MSWRDKITCNQLLDFCSIEYKDRQDIQTKFGMSNNESYHCVKWMAKALKHELIIKKALGKTNRKFIFKSRRWLDEDLLIIAEMRKKDF